MVLSLSAFHGRIKRVSGKLEQSASAANRLWFKQSGRPHNTRHWRRCKRWAHVHQKNLHQLHLLDRRWNAHISR